MKHAPLNKMLVGLSLLLLVLVVTTISCKNLDIEESNSRLVKAVVHSAAAGLGAVLADISDEGECIAIIRDYVDAVRFFDDGSGYFFVYYTNNINVAHAADKTLLGQDLSDYKDMRGHLVGKLFSEAAVNGGGYVTFWWPHPETKEEQRKIGYVEMIPGTDYYIGTGYYPDAK